MYAWCRLGMLFPVISSLPVSCPSSDYCFLPGHLTRILKDSISFLGKKDVTTRNVKLQRSISQLCFRFVPFGGAF